MLLYFFVAFQATSTKQKSKVGEWWLQRYRKMKTFVDILQADGGFFSVRLHNFAEFQVIQVFLLVHLGW